MCFCCFKLTAPCKFFLQPFFLSFSLFEWDDAQIWGSEFSSIWKETTHAYCKQKHYIYYHFIKFLLLFLCCVLYHVACMVLASTDVGQGKSRMAPDRRNGTKSWFRNWLSLQMILVVSLSPYSQIPGHKKHLKLGLSYYFFLNLYIHHSLTTQLCNLYSELLTTFLNSTKNSFSNTSSLGVEISGTRNRSYGSAMNYLFINDDLWHCANDKVIDISCKEFIWKVLYTYNANDSTHFQ